MEILFMLFIAILILGLIVYKQKPKGELGELKIKKILGHEIEGERYIINNIIIGEENKTSQIDHILINKYGIFVIETKNYSGLIYGKETNQNWTQVLAYGEVKNSFYNPIKQNATHIYNLDKLFKEKIDFINIVVFVNNDLSKINIDNVFTANQLKMYLKNIELSGTPIYSVKMIKHIYETIKQNENTQITDNRHIENIRKMKDNIANNICPRCGGKLVLRKGNYGEFFGCSNYPKCKFIKK